MNYKVQAAENKVLVSKLSGLQELYDDSGTLLLQWQNNESRKVRDVLANKEAIFVQYEDNRVETFNFKFELQNS